MAWCMLEEDPCIMSNLEVQYKLPAVPKEFKNLTNKNSVLADNKSRQNSQSTQLLFCHNQ